MKRLFVHAPGVHLGGGIVLLKELLLENKDQNILINIDERSISNLQRLEVIDYNIIPHSIFGRIKAEFYLSRNSKKDDIVLCFHGLPPLLPVKGKVVVFVQNRLHLENESLSKFKLKTRSRLAIERIICRFFRWRVHEYVVQTLTMQVALMNWHPSHPIVHIMPFYKIPDEYLIESEFKKKFDFVYVAEGESHKNHHHLISAFSLLAKEKIYPSICLTLSNRFEDIISKINFEIANNGLNISNIGEVSHEEIIGLYRSSCALIFPSTIESFGLPLLEASQLGLPILASESDFVRDVCTPVQTFDPQSPISISRAIKRFLRLPTKTQQIYSSAEFLEKISIGGCKK